MKRTASILLVVLAALVVAITTTQPLYDQIAYVVTLTVVIAYAWARVGARSVEFTRHAPAHRSQVGRYIEERFTVRNTSLVPKLWLEVRDLSELPGHRASRVITSLGPRRRRGWTVRTMCYRRGRFRLGPVDMTSGDAFGLFRITRRVEATASVVVYPYAVDLPAFLPPSGELPGGDALRRKTHHITTNVSGVRDYEPGDSFNRIHWKSTARTGRLIVKEFELDPLADVWLFPDMHSGVQVGRVAEAADEWLMPAVLMKEGPRVLEPSTEEYVVAITASLAKHFLGRNRAVGLAAQTSRREFIQPDRGDRQLGKIMETLAVIHARGQMPLAQVLAGEGMGLPRGTSVVVITPSADLRWVQVLNHLRRRGLRAIAVHVVPATFGEAPDSEPVLAELALHQIPTYVVRNGERLEQALSADRAILARRAG
ncbi:MAG: DUF58 domain-containing protein [Anaerolineales bacterium]